MHRLRFATFLTLTVLMAGPAAAQQGAGRSRVAEILLRARVALNDLKYTDADNLARGVLTLGTDASRADRIQALQVIAAALYPEEMSAQRRDEAIGFIRQLVQLDPDAQIPEDISWVGLRTLVEDTRGSTYAAQATPRRENLLAGPTGEAYIDVAATRPSRYTLFADQKKRSGTSFVIDTLGPIRQGTLRFRILNGDQPRVPSGDYELRIVAHDAASTDSLVVRYLVAINAPSLDLVPVPVTLDSLKLLPEISRPKKGVNIAIGVALGGVTAAIASALRAPDPVKASTSADSKAYLVGGGMALGGLLGAVLDHGSPLPQNVARNAELRTAFSKSVHDAEDENNRRRAAYRATMTVDLEAR